jgi:hypothetical protein
MLPRLVLAAVALLLATTLHADRAGAAATRDAAPPAPCTRPGAVRPGLEVLLADSVHLIRGRRVALLTNHTGVDRCGRRAVDLLVATPGVEVVALFAPEHGLAGTAQGGAVIRSGRDSASGVRVISLYGERLAPTAAMLRGVDVLLYDVQDVGARAYTFVWTMALAMRAAGEAGTPVLVLDRPNPIRADRVGGGLIEPRFRTITGLYPVPIRYGLTPGSWRAGSSALATCAPRRAWCRCRATGGATGSTRPGSRGSRRRRTSGTWRRRCCTRGSCSSRRPASARDVAPRARCAPWVRAGSPTRRMPRAS